MNISQSTWKLNKSLYNSCSKCLPNR